MKHKKLFAIGIVIFVILTLAFAGVVALSHSGIGVSSGIFLESKSGTPLVIIENSPISMSSERDLFDGLCTGDEIFIVHGPVAESYPGQTRIYAVFKLGEGTLDGIPHEVLESLIRLGWLDEDILD